MSVGWESLPLLPLRCVLQHLSLEDALAAMSVCQHWRHALLVYEGHRDTMVLRTSETEKNLFLARLFRKQVHNLHIYIDCAGDELDKFFNIVLPEYFDSVALEEILILGPSYLQQNRNLPPAKLRRLITESLIFKNSHCLTKLGIFGCEMDLANDSDRYMNEQLEYYSTMLTFSSVRNAGDQLLSSTNARLMMYSTIQHIAMDYEQIETETVETLSQLPRFQHLILNVGDKRPEATLDWERINAHFANGLDVSVNIIALPYKWFNDVMKNVLVEGLSLVSLKVFFCKTMHTALLGHVARLYKSSLRELLWADSPADPCHSDRDDADFNSDQMDACNVNPFILICWQCVNLRRLVIHGYWLWQYDVVGCVRLRKSLRRLEVSAVYGRRRAARRARPLIMLTADDPLPLHHQYVQQVNEFTEFPWAPQPWRELHAALRSRASPHQRAHYIQQEVLASMNTDTTE